MGKSTSIVEVEKKELHKFAKSIKKIINPAFKINFLDHTENQLTESTM